MRKVARNSPNSVFSLRLQHLYVRVFGCTQLLGRADDPKEFIRHGQPEGWTEITLSSGGQKRPVRVYHRIMRSGRTVSEWKLNGALICSFTLVIISTVLSPYPITVVEGGSPKSAARSWS